VGNARFSSPLYCIALARRRISELFNCTRLIQTQAIAVLVVAKAVAIAVFFFLLIQKVESRKTYRYRRLYLYVGYFTAYLEFQRMPFGRIIRPAFPEVVPIDHPNLDIYGTPVASFA
jgi:hypothetical protein